MNGDMVEIAHMMGEMERRLSDRVAEIRAGIAGLDGRMTTAISAAKDSQAAFRTELLGDGGRIKALENDLKSERMWSNIRTVVVIPILLAVHKGMVALGIKI